MEGLLSSALMGGYRYNCPHRPDLRRGAVPNPTPSPKPNPNPTPYPNPDPLTKKP